MIDLTFEKETLDSLSGSCEIQYQQQNCESLTERRPVAVTLTNASERWAKGKWKYCLVATSALIPRDLVCGIQGCSFLFLQPQCLRIACDWLSSLGQNETSGRKRQCGLYWGRHQKPVSSLALTYQPISWVSFWPVKWGTVDEPQEE